MVKLRRTKKNILKKRNRGASKQYRGGELTTLNETFKDMYFFRKCGKNIAEHAICKILKYNPHPNIVKIYRITDNYIDIELVKPISSDTEYDKNILISDAQLAKSHLQSLGIIYIDWKPDNMGIGADGKYKVFDFNLSGIITASDSNKWKLRPSPLSWSYRQAIANGLNDPTKIDDFAFDINFIREDYKELNDLDAH
jgi:serine/threonine protein kinase